MVLKITKIALIAVAALFVLFVFYVCINLFGTPWGRIYYENKMTPYLNEKYHSSFVVHHMRFNPLGSGYEGIAYPKNDPSLSFTVSQSTNNSYTDVYPSVFWSSEHAKPMKAFIQNLFPNVNQNSFTVKPPFGEVMGQHIPTFHSIHLDVGVNCLMMIKVEQNWFNLSPDEQKYEIEKIRKIKTYLQEHHFPVFVEFFYNTESVDNSNLKAIFITESGEIIQR